jgi:hypothetical protein
MRKASTDDIPQLVALMAEFYAEANYPLNRTRAGEAFAALLAGDRFGHVWLIEKNSEAVGHLVVTLCFSMDTMRLLISGNSGSGKSSFPRRLVAQHGFEP